MGSAETPTKLLHRLTSYVPGREWDEPDPDGRLVHGFTGNDPEHLPRFFKQYPPGLPRTALPQQLPPSSAALLDVLAGAADVPPGGLDLAQLGRLLFLAAGVTRTAERDGVRWSYRAAGSAGGRFPLELAVAVPDGHALPPGVHAYDAEGHALVRIGPPPAGGAPTVVVTGVPWRTGWRYRERGFRHLYWDAGTVLAQMLAAADSSGLPARLVTDFPDRTVTELVGADGRHEFPLALVVLGDGAPAVTPAGPAVAGLLDADGHEFPLVVAAQHAGDRERSGDAIPRGAPVDVAAGDGATVEEVVLRRGSMRRMDPAASLPRATLRDTLAVSLRGTDVRPASQHFIAVNAVEGTAPGLYRWPDLDTPLRTGALREELYGASLEQALPRDAAFVVIAAVDLTEVDDHGYRDVQLAAGLVAGRLHLAAHALGAAASGMTFRDADIPALLGADVAGLLWTCVGVGTYRGRPGGPPGSPTAVRLVHPA